MLNAFKEFIARGNVVRRGSTARSSVLVRRIVTRS